MTALWFALGVAVGAVIVLLYSTIEATRAELDALYEEDDWRAR